jgi:hypothetical protein
VIQNDRVTELQYRDEEEKSRNDGEQSGATPALRGWCNRFVVHGCHHIKSIIIRYKKLASGFGL